MIPTLILGGFGRVGAIIAAGGGGSAVTWNPADKDANITLTGGDLTAGRTGANGWVAARATLAHASGKHYYEILVSGGGAAPGLMMGVGTSAANLASYVGGSSGSIGYNSDNGKIYANGGPEAGFGAGWQSGDVIGFAYDAATGKMWWAKNNAWQASGDPAAGTNPAHTSTAGTSYFAMCSLYYGAGAQTIIGRFKSADFSYTPPSGFSAWE